MTEQKINHPRLDDADCVYIMSDDSMADARVWPDDMLLVKLQTTAEDGNIALVMYKGEVRIGRYSRHKDCEALTPANIQYQTILSDFDSPSFKIVGKVIAFIGALTCGEKGKDPQEIPDNVMDSEGNLE